MNLVHATLGPCRCQACGEEVLYVTQGNLRGWLHEDGALTCRWRRRGLTRREYSREWMRQKRAA